MRNWRKSTAGAFASLLLAALVHAAPTTTNFSDLWWNPAESGWGVNVSQQADFLFVTFFVYAADRAPDWYTAQLTYVTQDIDGNPTFSGNLYATQGPWYGGAFDPNAVTLRKAGTATFRATSIDAATLSYSVDGVLVTKPIERQTLRNESFAGTYQGFTTSTRTCNNPAFNGSGTTGASFTVTQSGTDIELRTAESGRANGCTYSGTYAQSGQMASVSGSYSCDLGESGTFQWFELQSSRNGFMGQYAAVATLGISSISCKVEGRVAGVKTD